MDVIEHTGMERFEFHTEWLRVTGSDVGAEAIADYWIYRATYRQAG